MDTIITIDFETKFDKEYSLRKMTNVEYVRDPRFKVLGCAVAINQDPPRWFPRSDFLQMNIDWSHSTVVSHNALFDALILTERYSIVAKRWGDTLALSRALLPLRKHSLEHICEAFGWPTDRKKILQEGLEEASPELIERCLFDAEKCRDIYYLLKDHVPEQEHELISLTTRWGVECKLELDLPLLQEALNEEVRARELAIAESGLPESVLASNPQFTAKVAELGVAIPSKTSATTGNETEALSKNDPEFQALMANRPDLAHIWRGRLAAKSTLGIKRAERFISIAKTGLMPMPLNYWGARNTGRWSGAQKINCLLPTTEVLTRNGWVELQKLDASRQQVAIWNPKSNAISFDYVIAVKQPFNGQLIIGQTQTKTHNLAYTPEHRIPYKTYKNPEIKFKTAEELAAYKKDWLLPVGAIYTGGECSITEDEARLMAAIQADAHINAYNGIVFWLKKRRKKERLTTLLNRLNLPFSSRDKANGFTSFHIPANRFPHTYCKYLGPWLLSLSTIALNAFVDEARHWDSHIRNDSFLYATSIKENAEWMQTAAHLTGRSACIGTRNNFKGWNKDPNALLYIVNVKPRSFVINEADRQPMAGRLDHSGFVYCLTTETGAFICRNEGSIHLTGNCQNLPRGGKLRKSIRAPKGQIIVVSDSAQIELRVSFWFAEQWDQLYRLATGQDIYKYTGASITNKHVEEIAKDSIERMLGKATTLGAGYGMGWRKFQHTCAGGPFGMPPIHLTEEQAFNAIDAYRRTNNNVRQAWYKADDMLNVMCREDADEAWRCVRFQHESILMPNGMKLHYPSLHQTEDGDWVYTIENVDTKIYGGKLYENLIQGLARIVIGEQILAIQERYDTVSSTHDEIIFLAPKDEAESAKAFALEVMSTSPKWAPDLPLSAEAGYAENYSK